MLFINAFKELINFKRTESCRQVKWPCWRKILQAPRMCANVQCPFLHKKQEDSSDKCHHNKLLGEGRTLYLPAGQKERKLGDIASIDFQDKLFLT